MTFTIIGLLGALAVVVSLVAAAVVLQWRERRRQARFDADVAGLRDEMRRLEARALGDVPGDDREGAAIELRKAELSEPLRAALRSPAGGGVPVAAS
ncbi:MAG: hypothetical protein ACXVQU_01190 [Actinomycetota bacterium]